MKLTDRIRLRKRHVVLALAAGSFVAAGVASAPRAKDLPALWDNLSRTIQTPLYPEQRRQLALHLPGLFPVPFTCLFRPLAGEWRTVLPGDEVAAMRTPANLTCSNGDAFRLQPESAVRVWARNQVQTHLEVERGVVAVYFREQPLRITAGDDFADLRPASAGILLASYAGPRTAYIKCLAGHAELSLSRSLRAPLRLAADDCRLDVVRAGEPGQTTVATGDQAYVDDLPLPRAERPALPAVPRADALERELRAKLKSTISLATRAGEHRALVATSAGHQEDCRLFRDLPGEAPRELQKYGSLAGELAIDPPAAARPPFFLACRAGPYVHVSNLVASLRSPAPASTPEAPVPTLEKENPASSKERGVSKAAK